MISFLTLTNLGRSKITTVFRLVSSLFWIIVHTITFTVILFICNFNPGIVTITNTTDDYKWSELALVQDLTILNALLISTIGLGFLSLVADVLTAYVRYH